jgi:hypothetical protein
MAEKEFEADDPYELVGMRVPMPAGVDAEELQARCFIEEYALMGMPSYKVMHMFKSEFFAGTHAILASRGEAFIEQIIEQVYGQSSGHAPGLLVTGEAL